MPSEEATSTIITIYYLCFGHLLQFQLSISAERLQSLAVKIVDISNCLPNFLMRAGSKRKHIPHIKVNIAIDIVI